MNTSPPCSVAAVALLAAAALFVTPTAARARVVTHSPRAPATVEVIATLLDPPPVTPHCGDMHIAVAMRYRVERVLRGTLTVGAVIYAIHGCPEMSRRVYNGPSAGTLTAFRVGDHHRLVLTRQQPSSSSGPGGASLWPDPGVSAAPPNTVFWTVRADPAP